MSFISSSVAAIRRLYQPEPIEGQDLKFFSETLSPEQDTVCNSFETVYTKEKRRVMMTRKEDQMIMAKNNGETVILKDLWSLLPGQWVSDAVVHYVVKAMVDPVGITDEGVAFFTSFFITKLFQEGMAENEGGGAFLYHGVKKWKKILKRPINEMDTLIFFRNASNMHWLVYVIFIGQKTIQEFDSLSGGGGDKEVLKGLYKWLEIEMKEVGIILEESEWH
jgi:Ulp1 family protease